MTVPKVPPDANGPEQPLQRVARGRKGMVATTHPDATRAGVEMLEKGGNASDAAVAAALALCVCEPAANGLGGQAMLLVHDREDGRTRALDGSSRAPNRATVHAIPEAARGIGHKATTVPSAVAAYDYVLTRYGSLTRSQVLAPAIRLARDGYRVTPLQEAIMAWKQDRLRSGNAGEVFLDGGRPWQAGSTVRQPVLADTLRRLERDGFTDFYRGDVAGRIVADMRAHKGLVDEHDLAQVPWPVEREVDSARFGRDTVATFPPAGAGRVMLEVLHILDAVPRKRADPDTETGACVMARIVEAACRRHLEEPRDPARHVQTPGRTPERAEVKRLARQVMHGGETSHISVMDREGNAVGLTQSIEEFYGACVMAPDLGFLYNNYISAFHTDDPGHPYYLRPNAVPWSNAAPTILLRRGRPRMVLGSPGSDRIGPSLAQVLHRMRRGADAYAAIEAPRLHSSGGVVHAEAARMGQDVRPALEADGFQVTAHAPYSIYFGAVQLVQRRWGRFTGVADPRRDGTAGGP